MNLNSTAAPDVIAKQIKADLLDRAKRSGMDQTSLEKLEEIGDEQAAEIRVEVPDTWVYRMAVAGVLAICLIIVIGTFLTSDKWGTDNFPKFLELTLATAIGAVAGMIVPTAKG